MDADIDQVFRLSAPCGQPVRRLFKAPLRLMSLLRYVHVELCAGGPVLIPAMAFPSMCVIVQGGVRIGGPDGLLITEGFMRGPNQRPVRLEWLPGTSLIVAMMRVGRVGRLFDVPANELANRVVPLEFITDCGSVRELTDAVRAGDGPTDWISALGDWLLARMQAESQNRVAPLCLPVHALNEPAEALAEFANLSLRQFERRFLSSYGVPLRDTRRLMRHMLAMATMLRSTPRRGQLTAVAHEAGYYDQAQMVREFAELSNMTPTACVRAMYGDTEQEDEARLLRYSGADRQLVITSPL
jgi:AraC-like DNA-binding protein